MNIYDIYDNQKIFTNYIANIALDTKNFISKYNEKNYFLGSKFIEANLCLLNRIFKEYEKQDFKLNFTIDNNDIFIKQNIIDEKPFCNLIEFRRLTDNQTLLKKLNKQPKVLIIAPLSGHFATLLNDTVETMLQDHNVFITDWKDAKYVDIREGKFGLDTYIFYVQDFIRKFDKVHLVSVCQPTVPSLAAVSLMSANNEKIPESLILMAGPIDVRKNPTKVNELATSKDINWFKQNLIYKVPNLYQGYGRRVYPGFLQLSAFVSMNYKKHFDSYVKYFFDILRNDISSIKKHEEFYDEYNAVLDMDEKYYIQTIEEVFQKFSLPNKKLKINNEIVDPSFIKNCRLLTIEGEKDDICGIGQTQAAHDLCSNIEYKEHHLIEGVGHYGVFSGKKWKNDIYPIIKSFINK